MHNYPPVSAGGTTMSWCVNLLYSHFITHYIRAPFRVQQVSQVSQALRGQEGFQEWMEIRDHQDSQDYVGTQGLR